MFCRVKFKKLGRMNNQRMKNKKCLSCKKGDSCVMLLPCQHKVLCVDCSKTNENRVLCEEKIFKKFIYDRKVYRRSKSKLTPCLNFAAVLYQHNLNWSKILKSDNWFSLFFFFFFGALICSISYNFNPELYSGSVCA